MGTSCEKTREEDGAKQNERENSCVCIIKHFKTRTVGTPNRCGVLLSIRCIPKKPPLLAHLHLDVCVLALLLYAVHLRVRGHTWTFALGIAFICTCLYKREYDVSTHLLR